MQGGPSETTKSIGRKQNGEKRQVNLTTSLENLDLAVPTGCLGTSHPVPVLHKLAWLDFCHLLSWQAPHVVHDPPDRLLLI